MIEYFESQHELHSYEFTIFSSFSFTLNSSFTLFISNFTLFLSFTYIHLLMFTQSYIARWWWKNSIQLSEPFVNYFRETNFYCNFLFKTAWFWINFLFLLTLKIIIETHCQFKFVRIVAIFFRFLIKLSVSQKRSRENGFITAIERNIFSSL